MDVWEIRCCLGRSARGVLKKATRGTEAGYAPEKFNRLLGGTLESSGFLWMLQTSDACALGSLFSAAQYSCEVRLSSIQAFVLLDLGFCCWAGDEEEEEQHGSNACWPRGNNSIVILQGAVPPHIPNLGLSGSGLTA